MEAEQAVLGSVLIDPAYMRDVMMAVSAQDFYIPLHRVLFEVMEGMENTREKPIDALTALDLLLKRRDKDGEVFLDEAGGRNYLFQMAKSVPSTANVMSYARIVREKAKSREGIALAQGIAETLRAESAEFEEISGDAGKLLQLLSGTSQQKVFSSAQLFRRFVEQMRKPLDIIETGMRELDFHAQIDKGSYVVVGGRPSTGKTALTVQFMLDIAKTRKVLYCSLETSADRLFQRGIANRSGVELRTLIRHELQREDEKQCVSDAMSPYVEKHLFYEAEAGGWTVEQVRSCALQLQSEVVFIDYLSLLEQGGKDMYEQVTLISKKLRTMAQNTGITVIALSQLNREAKGEMAGMHNLRQSGQVEQDADIVLILVRPDEPNRQGKIAPSQSKRYLRVEKCRDGASHVQIPLHFDGKTQRFTVIDEALEAKGLSWQAQGEEGEYPW